MPNIHISSINSKVKLLLCGVGGVELSKYERSCPKKA
jgi:hypothetical protein